MEKPFTLERRRAFRAKRVISIQFRLAPGRGKDPAHPWHLSTTQDMSTLGLSFLSEEAYAIDDVLELHVVMSGVLDIFKGYGRVVRVEKTTDRGLCLIAVKFVPRSSHP